MHAYDMSEYEKVIGVSDGRITGNFVALVPTTSARRDRRIWISAHDVGCYDGVCCQESADSSSGGVL